MDKQKLRYWEKRKAQRMWEHMEKAEDAADQIKQNYWRASGYINNQLDQIYDRYKSKHGLSDTEARNLLNQMLDSSSIEELKMKLKQAGNSREKRELLKVLEAPAYSARIQRFEALQQEIDALMKEQYRIERERSTRHYASLSEDAYYKSIYDVQKDAGYAFSFTHVSPDQIDKVLNSKWSGANYSARIWNNTNALAKELKQELLFNLITGRSEQETARIISNKFDTGAMEARRLVRTESCYIANEMEAQSYEECGIDRYIFVATLDSRTSEQCRSLDMKDFPVAKRSPGENCPPMHPWCRSTTIASVDANSLAEMKRRARDPETGKTYTVPTDMNYSAWHEKYVENQPSKVNAEKALKNRKTDRKQYQKYKSLFRDEEDFKSFENFKKMKYNDSERWDSFKKGKQEKLNSMDFSEMQDLVQTLGDKETRLWYKAHDEKIPSIIDSSLSLEEQARKACELRNTYRTQARELMSNQQARMELDIEAPNKSFDELVESKMKRKGLTREQAIRDIYDTATKTNKKVNKMLGLE